VVSEVGESEGDAFDAFGEVVDRFCWAVGYVGVVPGDDLITPAADGSSQTLNFWRHFRVGEVGDAFVDPLNGEVRVGVGVDVSDDFIGAVGEPHFLVWVTSTK